MTRFRGRTVPPNDIGVVIDLIMGPTEGELTEDELELAWEAFGREDLRVFNPGCPGTRPWAYWKFELGEDLPDNEPVRLAELGLLRVDEIAAIAERANEARMRVDTPAEHYGPDCHPDRDAVELHEAVKRALGRAARRRAAIRTRARGSRGR
jgi:hypothetical protein